MIESGRISLPQNGGLVSNEYKMRMRIFRALYSCMQNCEINKITVREICKSASISRASFYNYFTDKYEIAKWYAGLLAQYGINEAGRSMTWRDSLLKTIQGMRVVDPFFQNIGRAFNDDFLMPCSADRRQSNITETLTVFKGYEITAPLSLQIRAFALSETYLVNDWAMREPASTAETFAEALSTVVPSELYSILQTLSSNAPSRPMLNLFPIYSSQEWSIYLHNKQDLI